MDTKSSFLLLIGFGILIALIAILGIGAMSRVTSINEETQTAQDAYLRNEAFRRGMVTDMYLADILVRDYLLDPDPERGPGHRQDLLAIRDSLQDRLNLFSESLGDSATPDFKKFRSDVEDYWESLDPIFEWTPKQKAERTWIFLARRVLPKREAVVHLGREMARLNSENLERERQRIESSHKVLHGFLSQTTAFAVLIGSIVALLTTYRVFVLERVHTRQRQQIQQTQDDLRRLSNRLVQAQEGERRNLSRELHDEVGQVMTALGIQLGGLEDVKDADPLEFRKRLLDLKRLNADAMRSVRDLAMGLRPSMLDDLGLEAALEWQGREFSRHTGVPAVVEVQGSLDLLTDTQRTCIYRVVQEALTNCARHAKASNVLVSVTASAHEIRVLVRDNGIGFSTKPAINQGLGLLGIQERVQALDGKVTISSGPAGGTVIQVQLPTGTAA